MISRQKKYLREIIASYFGATYDDLYALSDVSEKTLKADLQVIKSVLSKYNLAIKEDKNRLYIPFEQKEDFLNAYEEIINEDEKNLMANEYMQRKMYILTYLCKSDDYISMNLLADRLYISKSSVSMIVHDLKEEISRLVPAASLTVSGCKGIRLNAKEKEVRELLVRAFAKDGGTVTENQYFLNYLDKEFKDKLEPTLNAVNQFMQEQNIFVADDNISKTIAHILIIAQRNKNGCVLDDADFIADDLYDKLANKLQEIDLFIAAQELSSLPLLNLNRAVIDNPLVIKVVHQFISEVNEEFKEEILRVEDAYPLIAHIDEILKKRVKTSYLKDFVFDTMLQRLLSAYILCGRLSELLNIHFNITKDEENRAYMAMHVQYMYRKHLEICENMLLYDANVSECNMIKTDLEKHFGAKASISPVYTRWDIEKQLKLNKYSIILSTQSMLGLFDEIPFLKINSFLTNEDYDAINKIVYKNRPIKIVKGGEMDIDNFVIDNIKTKVNKEILFVDGVYIACTINPELKMGAYEASYKNTRIFILNNDMKGAFVTYHRLINCFGQMIKEGKI